MKVRNIQIKKIKDRYQSLSLPARAAAWFTICYIIQRGIQFVGMPVFTRIMSADEYGIYTTFLSWINLISIITSLGIYGNVFNKAMIKYENQRKEYISSVQWLTAVFTGIFIIAVCVLKYSDILKLERSYIVMMAVYLFFFPSVQYWYQIQRFEFKYRALAGVTLFISLSNILLGIAGALISGGKGMALIAATVFSQSVIGVFLFIKIAFSGRVFYKKDFWKWSLKLALPLVPGSLSEILLGHADRIMIRYICGPSMAAIYTTVYQISMILTIIRMGINGAYIPWLYYSLRNREYQNIKNVIRLIVVLFACLTVLAMMLGPELMKIAAPELYYEAVTDIPAIMLGCFFVSLYYLFEQAEIFYEKVFFSTVVSVIGAVLNIILNFLFIRNIGYLAAGFTTMFTYAAMAVLHFVYILYLGRKNKDITAFFDFKYIFAVSVLLTGAGIGCLALYKMFFAIRFGIIVFMAVLLYHSRKKIIDLISLIRNSS